MKKINWLSTPPALAVPIFLITYLVSPSGGGGLSFGFWTIAVTFFILLTMLYLYAAARQMEHWLPVLQLMAQGELLASTAVSFGNFHLTWIGLLLILIAFVASVPALGIRRAGGVKMDSPSAAKSGSAVMPVWENFDKFPFPAYSTDTDNKFIAVSDGLVRLSGKSREDILSMDADKFIPPSKQIAGKTWQVSRLENDGKSWFLLSEETQKIEKTDEAPVEKAKFSDLPIGDTGTILFSEHYAKLRAIDELARIKRYKRWGMFLLVEFSFSYSGGTPPSADAKEKGFFRSYCAYMKSALRTCDILCRAGEFAVLAFLPETVGGDSLSQVIQKVGDFKTPLGDLINGIPGEIDMRVGSFFANASSQDMDYITLKSALNESLVAYKY